jgi:DNA-binding XRE family transcriptional regulator
MSPSLGTLPSAVERTSAIEPVYWTPRPAKSSAQPRPVLQQRKAVQQPLPATAPAVLANDVSSRFGRRLREMRHSRSLTQADMARKFGIDRSFISEIECGRKAISLPMLEVIALGLQITLSELFHDL